MRLAEIQGCGYIKIMAERLSCIAFSLNTCMCSFLLLYFSQVFVVTVWSVELYMVPLALLVLFAYNFSLVRTGKVNNTQDAQASKMALMFLA